MAEKWLHKILKKVDSYENPALAQTNELLEMEPPQTSQSVWKEMTNVIQFFKQ